MGAWTSGCLCGALRARRRCANALSGMFAVVVGAPVAVAAGALVACTGASLPVALVIDAARIACGALSLHDIEAGRRRTCIACTLAFPQWVYGSLARRAGASFAQRDECAPLVGVVAHDGTVPMDEDDAWASDATQPPSPCPSPPPPPLADPNRALAWSDVERGIVRWSAIASDSDDDDDDSCAGSSDRTAVESVRSVSPDWVTVSQDDM